MMSNGLISGVFVAPASNSMLLETNVGPDLGHRNQGGQVSHAHQIVGGARARNSFATSASSERSRSLVKVAMMRLPAQEPP
jgi:hypothetical protein